MSLYTYQNGSGQRFTLPERALEPREDVPLRYCTRCGSEIYYGTDTLCDGCLEETCGRKGMLEYMEAYPDTVLELLADCLDDDFLDGFFESFYERYESAFEKWRRS